MPPDTPAGPYLVVEWSGGGGLGHYAFLLADALARARPDVTLVTRRGFELRDAPRAHRVVTAWRAAPAWRRGPLRSTAIGIARIAGWFHVCRLVLRRRDARPVIHLQGIDRSPEILFAAVLRLMGATVVVTLHNAVPHDSGRIRRASQAVALRIPHGFVAHTAEVRSEIRRHRGSRAPVRVLPHPTYRRLAEVGGDGSGIHRGRRLRIGAFGMIRPYKGLEFVVRAVDLLAAGEPPVEFRVVGRPGDREWAESLLATLPPDTVSRRLEYVPLPDLVREIRSADLLLLGHRSSSESGIAQLALGAGVPVIAPRAGALATLLATRPEWLYEPGDVDDAVERTRRVLGDLSRDRGGLREAALEVADGAPGWDRMAREVLLVVEEVAEDASGAPRAGG